MKPDVSVIVTAYNVERYIARAMRSALDQQGPLVEVIVVDDCSTDGTWAVISGIADARLKPLRLPANGGPSVARNAGIAQASGAWIAVLDGDDAFEPDRLARCLARAAAGADIVVDNLTVLPETGGGAFPMFPPAWFSRLATLDLAGFIGGNRSFLGGYAYGYLKPVFSAEFLRRHGLSYDPDIRIGEDYLLLAEALASGAVCAVEQTAGYLYTVRAGSISQRLMPSDVARIAACDRKFLSRHALGTAALKAQKRREAGLKEAQAFTELVEAIKQRNVPALFKAVGLSPLSVRNLWRPVAARIGRLVRPRKQETRTMAGEPVYVGLPVVSARDGKARISSTIRIDGEDKVLWFEVDAAYADFLAADTLDAFAAAALLPAILRGRDIRLKGPMSSRLYYNISRNLIPIFSDYLGVPRTARIFHDGLLTGPAKKGSGVAAGFSGGIDSLCNYRDHSGDRAPEEFCITHFLFNNIGSHGQVSPEQDRALFLRRYTRLEPLARRENIPLIAVDSNFDEFMKLDFERTHTLRNAVVALLLQNKIGKFIYASSNPFGKTRIALGYDMSPLECVILPMLGTERLDCIPAGAQMTRVEKTERVAEMEISREYLDVCVAAQNAPEGFMNCSCCGKCLRTQLTLEVQGNLGKYEKVFMVERYNMLKNLYLISVMSSKASLLKEVRDLIRQKGYRVSPAVRAISVFYPSCLTWCIPAYLVPHLIRRKRLAAFINKSLA